MGSLNFTTITTRLNIIYVIFILLKYFINPLDKHLEFTIRILRYIIYIKYLAIGFNT